MNILNKSYNALNNISNSIIDNVEKRTIHGLNQIGDTPPVGGKRIRRRSHHYRKRFTTKKNKKQKNTYRKKKKRV
jgi:hypothetical protein